MDRKMIGRCGKFCGECQFYVGVAGEGAGASGETATCGGCQGPAEACCNVECKVVACLDERGYRYCAQCAEINDCTKYAQVNAEHGGRPKIFSTQLKAWGEDRWLRFHLGDGAEDEEAK